MKTILSLLVLIILSSCSTSYITIYKITSPIGSTYYTNSYEIKNGYIAFKEYGRKNINYKQIILPQPFIISTTPKEDKKIIRYINNLKEQGYSTKWATHKALVELNIIPIDEEYISIQED